MTQALYTFLQDWQTHYEERLDTCDIQIRKQEDGIAMQAFIVADKLKEGNSPCIYYHGRATKDVLVLTHGLSDSPWYIQGIAKRFYEEGVNVIMPLLPAHGLKEPDKALEDKELDIKWRKEKDKAVELAKHLGERISLGGFSTGGVLGLNKILRDSESIKGGLFLFSAALSVGDVADDLGHIRLIGRLLKAMDGKIKGIGEDPYKYPDFPNYGGFELTQIINENDNLSKGVKISQPTFVGHSIHDTVAKPKGILELLENHVEIGTAFLICMPGEVVHADLPLAIDPPIKEAEKDSEKRYPKANPQFGEMMDAAIRFFKKHVVGE